MAKTAVGINGLGRIGRTIVREIFSRKDHQIELVGINNPGDLKAFARLLQYDSLHGRFPAEIRAEGNQLIIGNKTIPFFNSKDPKEIPWSSVGAQVVIDATGVFKDKDGLSLHLGESVRKVIMCAPGKNLDGTFVMGINNENYNSSEHHVISNASCTTNCLAPVAKVLHAEFEIVSGFMTTVHAYTSDQNLLDGVHSDPRRARAAALSMIPTTTGAAKALGEVLPALSGKLDGYAIRVPTPNVSVVDLTVSLKKKVTLEEVNQALKKASEGYLKNILAYSEEELVSIDYMGRRESSIVDACLTQAIGDQVKVVSWYDNEVGFSNRVIDLASYIGAKL